MRLPLSKAGDESRTLNDEWGEFDPVVLQFTHGETEIDVVWLRRVYARHF